MPTLKERLQKEDVVLGYFGEIPSPHVQEVMTLAGFDFTIIDFEHGTMDLGVAENMMRAIQVRGGSVVVRVPDFNYSLLSKALDMGADAVQMPQISTKEEAMEAVKYAKFQPDGERGAAHIVRAARYGNVPRLDYYSGENKRTLLICQIEGVEGMANADEIMSVEGVDMIFIGPHDLAQSLGIPGQTEHPMLEEKMQELVEKAKQHGKIVGTYVESKKALDKWKKAGVRYLAYTSDTEMIYSNVCNLLQELKK